MGFQLDVSVPVLTVFVQGLLSFFSPCVLPLLPLYIGYLSGGTMVHRADGSTEFDKKKVLVNTLFFVLGISFAFFILGFGMSALGQFFQSNQGILAKVGGVLIVLFGLYQLGIFGTSQVLAKERRVSLPFEKLAMSPWVALLMGFTFSFAWTPCVGPVLASVLLMTASAASTATGFLLIGVYTLGFVLPFLAVGFFTTGILALFRKYRKVVRYTVKVGGVLLIAMGVMIFTGTMDRLTGVLSEMTEQPVVTAVPTADRLPASTEAVPVTVVPTEEPVPATTEGATVPATRQPAVTASPTSTIPVLPAIDFTLVDQNGESHTLSDYRGKTVFLNFWATWCPPCKAEMPDIQKLYEDFGENSGDLIVLGVAGPNQGREKSAEEVAAFLTQNGYTYPVVMDITGMTFARYGIMSYPTTFMIDREGNVFGYVRGGLTEKIMLDIVEQTMTGVRK